MNLLNAQRTYEQARLTLVQAQAARLADTAALFQALGGGWWIRADVRARSADPGGRLHRCGGRHRDGAAAGTDPGRKPLMIKRMAIMLVAVGLVLGGIFGFQAFKASMIKKFMSQMSAPPQTVSTAKAAYDQWQSTIQAVGSLRAVKGADLSLETAGTIDSITFESGDDVEAGMVLLKLRADDDVAKLESLQATAALSHITYDRDLKQAKIQAVSQATLDTDAANQKNAEAQVAEQQAVLDTRRRYARRSPGHLGIRAVDLGQYLGDGIMVVTLQALDPIYLDFFVPQQAVDQVRFGIRPWP